jgi:DNA ligase-1
MKLLEDLASTNKANKKRLLRAANDLEKMVFLYALNPYYTYGVSSSFDTSIFDTEEPTPELFKLLDSLRTREISGNEAKRAVSRFAEDNGELIFLILSRRLSCGTAVNTFNQVHKGYIPTFKIQLAKEVPLSEVKFPVLAQTKFDGVRIITVIRDKVVKLYTRGGNVLPMPKLSALLSERGNMMLDGELMLRPTATVRQTRSTLAGMVNSAIHGGEIDELQITYKMFDVLLLDEWDNKNCPRTEHQRAVNRLSFLYGKKPVEEISVIVGLTLDNKEDVIKLYNEVIEEGGEGLVLKDPEAKYEFKRSTNWIKMVPTKKAYLTCIDTVDGKNNFTGMIGSLVCEGVIEGNNTYVNVGSGLTERDRKRPTNCYLARTIEVKYNETTKNAKGTWSLLFPRFVKVISG